MDGHTAKDGNAVIERRLLDSEPWHVANYDSAEGWCRVQRGPKPKPFETFTSEEITIAGTYAEGAVGVATTKTRERSAHLRVLAREHYAKQSSDGRLHCAACDWAPPVALELSGPIVEIHHAVGISSYSFPGAEAKALGILNNFTSPVKVQETAFAEIYRHGMRLPVQT